MMAKNPNKKPAQYSKKHLDRMHREQRQTRLIIFASIAIVVAVIGLIIYGIIDQKVLRGMRPVAVVEGEKITADQFRAFTKYYRYNLIQQSQQAYQIAQMFGNDPNFTNQLVQLSSELETFRAGSQAVDQMVDDLIVRHEAVKRGVTVSAEEIEIGMQEALNYFSQGTPTPQPTQPIHPTATLSPLQLSLVAPTSTIVPTLPVTNTQQSPITATETLTPEKTPTLSASQTPLPTSTPFTFESYQNLYATVVADLFTNYEIPEDTLRRVIESNLIKIKVLDQVVEDVPCTEEQIWAQHILVDDENLAKEIQQKAEAGEDWLKLAAEFSKDTSNKDQGGDLGWFGRGKMVAEFEDAAYALEKPGQISQPIKSESGWHVIRLVSREDRSLTDSECESMKNQKFTDWLDQVRTNLNIDIRDLWQEVVPLNPTLPPEIQSAVEKLGSAGAPEGFPTPAP